MESHHLTSRSPLQFKDGKRPSAQDADDSDSSIGSLEDIDNVNEDLDRDENTRAAGFYGKNSEVSWMQRLEDNVERESSMSLSPITPTYSNSAAASNRKPSRNIPISMMNYHLDDLDIPPLDGSDPYIVPPRAVADEYLNTYFTFVHPSFPAIRRPTYVSQYRLFYDRPSHPPRKWLGILNMVFAIGCHYSKLTNPDNNSSEDDSVYFARARKLIFDENVLFEHADLQQIQVEFLVALYLLCLGQINRYDMDVSGIVLDYLVILTQTGHPNSQAWPCALRSRSESTFAIRIMAFTMGRRRLASDYGGLSIR